MLQALRGARGKEAAAPDGVSGAKANFKKNIIFVETELPDAALAACITDAGFVVKEIRERKGIFG